MNFIQLELRCVFKYVCVRLVLLFYVSIRSGLPLMLEV